MDYINKLPGADNICISFFGLNPVEEEEEEEEEEEMTMEGKAIPKPIIFLSFLVCFFWGKNVQLCEAKEVDRVFWGYGVREIKGMFVFGSSLVDNGNNNLIEKSIAKANYQPYGIDFALGASGRFTNGKNVVDFLCEFLGLPSYIPAFYDPATNGEKIFNGVNFASGGSGIRDDTGAFAGKVVSLSQQIANFESVTLPELATLYGGRQPLPLDDYWFLVGSGGNDYSLNYFLFKSSLNISVATFTENLVSSLSLQLKKLYSLGGRKFVLMGVSPLGCNPVVRRRTEECDTAMNMAACLFYLNLKSMVNKIRPEMPGSTIVIVNSYAILTQIIQNPAIYGFKDSATSCCEVGANGILCRGGGRTCLNRQDYVFFDGLHPTEAANYLIAKAAFSSRSPSEVYPMNIEILSKVC